MTVNSIWGNVGKTIPPKYNVNLGFDTEYSTSEYGEHPNQPALTQLAIPTTIIASENHYHNYQHQDLWGKKLVEVKGVGSYVALAFKCLDIAPGSAYQNWLAGVIDHIRQWLFLPTSRKCGRYGTININLYAFFNAAELSLMLPELESTRHWMRNSNTVQLITIQKAGIVTNWKHNKLNSHYQINILDTKLLIEKGNLASLGEVLGLPKHHHDFNLQGAREAVEVDNKEFLEYSLIDSVIPVGYLELYHQGLKTIIQDLVSNKVLSPQLHSKISKMSIKAPLTAASVSEKLMSVFLEERGLGGYYKEQVEALEKDYLPSSHFYTTKGGFNKYIYDKPQVFLGYDDMDISGAYGTALANVKLSLSKDFSRKTPFPDKEYSDIKEVAAWIDAEVFDGIFLVKWNIPLDVPERDLVTLAYIGSGENCSPYRTDTTQALTHYEILNLASITPQAKIIVEQGVYHAKKDVQPDQVLDMGALINPLLKLKDDYKVRYGKSSIQRNVVKLIINSFIGKLAQNRENPDSVLLRDAIVHGGQVNGSINVEHRSSVFNPFHFNLITSLVRCVATQALVASDGIMAITDGIFCPHQNFVARGDIPYESLRTMVDSFSWECDVSNKNLVVYKERDYVFFEDPSGDFINTLSEVIKQNVVKKLTSIDLGDAVAIKAATRGIKCPPGQSKSEFYNYMLLQAGSRLVGGAIHNPHQFKLVSVKETLQGKGFMCTSQFVNQDTAGIGSHTIKVDNLTETEFFHKMRLKKGARRKGYADILHYQLEAPGECAAYIKASQCQPLTKVSTNISADFRGLLSYMCWLMLRAQKKNPQARARLSSLGITPEYITRFSQRRLAACLGIGKSTMQRWCKSFEQGAQISAWEARWGMITDINQYWVMLWRYSADLKKFPLNPDLGHLLSDLFGVNLADKLSGLDSQTLDFKGIEEC